MPRKGEVPKRDSLPDPKYTDAPLDVRKRITKFMNTVMTDGKKSTAEGIVYGAFDIVEKRAKEDPIKVFDARARQRQAEARGQVPPRRRLDLPGAGRRSPGARQALGMRWLVIYSRDRGEKTMVEKLAGEILDASQQPRQRGEEARRHAQDGGGEQGVRSLPLVGLQLSAVSLQPSAGRRLV